MSLIKKIVISNGLLRGIAIFFRRIYLKYKYDIRYGKKSFIGFSVYCEGKNGFGSHSSITSSTIGYGSYIAENSNIRKSRIGRYCSIGPNVKCIFGKHPSKIFVSTHPAFFSLNAPVNLQYSKTQRFEEFAKPKNENNGYSIVIGNDVWIGANVSLMEGVTVGDGAIIAANSLVNKNIAPYSIVGGVPAKKIKMRFNDENIVFLKNLRWWDRPSLWIQEYAVYFNDIKELQNRILNGRT